MRWIAILFLVIQTQLASSQNVEALSQLQDLDDLETFIRKNSIDDCVDGYNLLTIYTAAGNKQFVKHLLKEGVDPNAACTNRYTALMAAAEYDQTAIAKILIARGADPYIRNARGRTALDLAKAHHHYLFAEAIYNYDYRKLTGWDGPYLFKGPDGFHALEVRQNGRGDGFVSHELVSHNQLGGHDFFVYDEKGKKLFPVKVNGSDEIPEAVFDLPEKLIAISDIEGQFSVFADLLLSNKVIDEEYNWTFGNGHLVLNGDFFDRGNQVTQGFWLIYKLEKEAERAGGKVHFIIGNHEQMNLDHDHRYVDDKYFANAALMGMGYGSLYGPGTVLGDWLRTKNAMVRIGNLLFCHGGLSPGFAAHKLTIAEINEKTRAYWDKPLSEVQSDKGMMAIFNHKSGVFWYRGMFRKEMSQKEVDNVLKAYQAEHLILGHTPVYQIAPLYEGRVIGIDVPHVNGPAFQKAMLVENGMIYEVGINGKRRKVMEVKGAMAGEYVER